MPNGNNKHGFDNDLLPDCTSHYLNQCLPKIIRILGYFTDDSSLQEKRNFIPEDEDVQLVLSRDGTEIDDDGALMYHQISKIRCTLVGNKIADYSNVVRASPVGAAPTTSSFSM